MILLTYYIKTKENLGYGHTLKYTVENEIQEEAKEEQQDDEQYDPFLKMKLVYEAIRIRITCKRIPLRKCIEFGVALK